jgi:hypothetical protein
LGRIPTGSTSCAIAAPDDSSKDKNKIINDFFIINQVEN